MIGLLERGINRTFLEKKRTMFLFYFFRRSFHPHKHHCTKFNGLFRHMFGAFKSFVNQKLHFISEYGMDFVTSLRRIFLIFIREYEK